MTAVLTATAEDIVNAALRLIGEVDANQPVEASQAKDGLEALNYLVKSWQAQGLHLWTKTEGILFLDAGKTDYLLGPGGDETANADDFISSEMAIAGATSDTTITIDSTTGMVVDDKIGVLLDDGSRQWTTIKSFTVTPGEIVLDTALTGAAAIDNSVFTFTNLIDRPLRVLQLRRDKIGSTDEIEATQWSREEYFAQPNKSSQGTINNWYYSPQLANGRVYIWQTANSADQLAKFTYERPINISDDNATTQDFPSEWFRTLKYNLAADIGPEYTISQNRLALVTAKAAQLLDESLGFDEENDSMSMQPDMVG